MCVYLGSAEKLDLVPLIYIVGALHLMVQWWIYFLQILPPRCGLSYRCGAPVIFVDILLTK